MDLDIKTLKDLLDYLKHLPDETKVDYFHLDTPSYVVVVDSKSVARKVLNKTERRLLFSVTLPQGH